MASEQYGHGIDTDAARMDGRPGSTYVDPDAIYRDDDGHTILARTDTWPYCRAMTVGEQMADAAAKSGCKCTWEQGCRFNDDACAVHNPGIAAREAEAMREEAHAQDAFERAYADEDGDKRREAIQQASEKQVYLLNPSVEAERALIDAFFAEYPDHPFADVWANHAG